MKNIEGGQVELENNWSCVLVTDDVDLVEKVYTTLVLVQLPPCLRCSIGKGKKVRVVTVRPAVLTALLSLATRARA